MGNEGQVWWRSKTLWLSVVIIAIGITQVIAAQYPSGGITLALGILNAINRFLTDRPITK